MYNFITTIAATPSATLPAGNHNWKVTNNQQN